MPIGKANTVCSRCSADSGVVPFVHTNQLLTSCQLAPNAQEIVSFYSAVVLSLLRSQSLILRTSANLLVFSQKLGAIGVNGAGEKAEQEEKKQEKLRHIEQDIDIEYAN